MIWQGLGSSGDGELIDHILFVLELVYHDIVATSLAGLRGDSLQMQIKVPAGVD